MLGAGSVFPLADPIQDLSCKEKVTESCFTALGKNKNLPKDAVQSVPPCNMCIMCSSFIHQFTLHSNNFFKKWGDMVQ